MGHGSKAAVPVGPEVTTGSRNPLGQHLEPADVVVVLMGDQDGGQSFGRYAQ